MNTSFLQRFDSFAEINLGQSNIAVWFDRAIFIFLFLTIIFAPQSIAATQIAWLIGMFLAVIRYFIAPRPKLLKNPLTIWLWSLFGWSIISAIFSYAPDISLDKLKNVTLFFIMYFVFYNVRSVRLAKILAISLVASCLVNVLWTPIERLIGRGVEVQNVKGEITDEQTPDGIKNVHLRSGDTILEVNGKKVRSPDDILNELQKTVGDQAKLKLYRPDYYRDLEIPFDKTASFRDGSDALGFASWKTSRNWRSTGFYSHYVTYAEVLQLILSLTFGFFIALPQKFSKTGAVLMACLGLMAFALLLTVTRASQLAFMISAFSIVLLGANRRTFLILLAIALPVALIGLIFLQSSRKVGFFDRKDDSILYREMMWRDGFRLATESPRHLIVGVGMDSTKRFWQDWGLFDNGKLPIGHFHSMIFQLAVERGIPALLLWLMIVFTYAKTLWKSLREHDLSGDWQTRGILLGAFGGLLGFVASGLVEYNLGDSTVAMVFYIIAGISLFLTQAKSADLTKL